MTEIGFVGLGVMGSRMVRNLLAADYDVTVADIDESAVAAMVEAGATGAERTADAVAGADVVLLSLPGPAAVEAVVDEVETALGPGAVLVDLTTSTPETTDAVAERLADRDVEVIGAPVSGGKSGAEAGTLTIMCGGDEAVVEACDPLFAAIGEDVFHVGPRPGHGHAVKLLNNYLSFTALLATSEAVVLGDAAGLDRETLVDVFAVSSGRNSANQEKIPNQVLTGQYQNGFTLELMEKDIRLMTEFSEDQGAPVLIGNTVKTLTEYARQRYGGDGDMTRVYDLLEDLMT